MMRPYDVFISYVVEDREVVETLVTELEKRKLKVWYARRELYPGAEISQLIRDGLEASRYGVALMSPEYKSHWAYGEMFMLMKRRKSFIPVIHEISYEALCAEHPELSHWYGLDTQQGLERVAGDIAKRVQKKNRYYYPLSSVAFYLRKKKAVLAYSIAGLLVLALLLLLSQMKELTRPGNSLVQSLISKRISQVEELAQARITEDIFQGDFRQGSLGEIERMIAREPGLKQPKYFSNHFDFSNAAERIKTAKGLQLAGIIKQEWEHDLLFGLSSFKCYIVELPDSLPSLTYCLVNTPPPSFEIISRNLTGEGRYELRIRYANPVRYVRVDQHYNPSEARRNRKVFFIGLKPEETLELEKQGDEWKVIQVR